MIQESPQRFEAQLRYLKKSDETCICWSRGACYIHRGLTDSRNDLENNYDACGNAKKTLKSYNLIPQATFDEKHMLI